MGELNGKGLLVVFIAGVVASAVVYFATPVVAQLTQTITGTLRPAVTAQ